MSTKKDNCKEFIKSKEDAQKNTKNSSKICNDFKAEEKRINENAARGKNKVIMFGVVLAALNPIKFD